MSRAMARHYRSIRPPARPATTDGGLVVRLTLRLPAGHTLWHCKQLIKWIGRRFGIDVVRIETQDLGDDAPPATANTGEPT